MGNDNSVGNNNGIISMFMQGGRRNILHRDGKGEV